MKLYTFALCALLAVVSGCAAASGGCHDDDILVYFPNGRAAFYFGCDVVEVKVDVLAANCHEHFENQPGTNPLPGTGHEPTLHMEVFGITPGVSPWYRVDHANGSGACRLTSAYSLPVRGTAYFVECDGTTYGAGPDPDFIFGDTFDGYPTPHHHEHGG